MATTADSALPVELLLKLDELAEAKLGVQHLVEPFIDRVAGAQIITVMGQPKRRVHQEVFDLE